jgi:hypothetical protein
VRRNSSDMRVITGDHLSKRRRSSAAWAAAGLPVPAVRAIVAIGAARGARGGTAGSAFASDVAGAAKAYAAVASVPTERLTDRVGGVSAPAPYRCGGCVGGSPPN